MNATGTKNFFKDPFLFFGCLLLFLWILPTSAVSDGIKEGLRLAAETVIPSVFPAMVLSELWASLPMRSDSLGARIFTRLFGVRGEGSLAFLCGLFCGFPLGVKTATDLYKQQRIGKEEAERLLGFSNNPGPAFLIAGIGVGLYESAAVGILLWGIVALSAFLIGLISGIGKPRVTTVFEIKPQRFSLVESIKKSGNNTVSVTAFVSFFCAVSTFIIRYLPYETRYCLLPFLEVTGACVFAAGCPLSPLFKFVFTAFCLGFSGISVHLQAASFLADTDLSLRPYLRCKLYQGVLAGGLAFLLFPCLSP